MHKGGIWAVKASPPSSRGALGSVAHGLSASPETSAASTWPSSMRTPRAQPSCSRELLGLRPSEPGLRKVDPSFTRRGSEARAGLGGGAGGGGCQGSLMSVCP